MIRIHEIKISALENTETLPARIERRLHLPSGSVKSFSIVKESIDARKKPDVFIVYSLDIECDLEDSILADYCRRSGIKWEYAKSPEPLTFPLYTGTRPVVAGFGPCGIFAALALAEMGANPIVLERGPAMEERILAVEKFWKDGILDPNANCQFGEGGAGTFSDGKLTTGTKSVYQRLVLENFVKAGANPEILYKQKPHIGTDMLRSVVVNLRKRIEELGGEVFFNAQLSDIEIKGNKLSSVFLSDGRKIECDKLILALGHSARDTIRTLYKDGIFMEQKQFSMGLRIEHPQSLIDKAQYGRSYKSLGPADYKLNIKTKDGRGVYSFCMCPGGTVVNASSQEGCITCNGMSYSKRDSGKANSAILADVRTSDFGSDDPLAGIAFQEQYEKAAYEMSGSYALPTEKLDSFMTLGKLKECLPDFVYVSLVEAIPLLGKKLKGFDDPDALLYALESRSSSPVRMKRSPEGLAFIGGSPLFGVYPAGGGAGYAGGIVSAACDGIRTAFKLAGIDTAK